MGLFLAGWIGGAAVPAWFTGGCESAGTIAGHHSKPVGLNLSLKRYAIPYRRTTLAGTSLESSAYHLLTTTNQYCCVFICATVDGNSRKLRRRSKTLFTRQFGLKVRHEQAIFIKVDPVAVPWAFAGTYGYLLVFLVGRSIRMKDYDLYGIIHMENWFILLHFETHLLPPSEIKLKVESISRDDDKSFVETIIAETKRIGILATTLLSLLLGIKSLYGKAQSAGS